MSIFEFSDYRAYLRQHLGQGPRKGRGQFTKLAAHLRIHPTVVSQVFSGLREFSEEQAVEIAEMIELTAIESKYFNLLVRISNASTAKLKSKLKLELEEVRKESKSSVTRVQVQKSLTDTERAIFYSSWLYSAMRLYCSTAPAGKSVEEIAERFDCPRVKTLAIIEFLLRSGLVIEANGKYQMGPQTTYVDRHSPFLPKHLANWRIKAVQRIDQLSEEELMYSSPCSLSLKDMASLREKLLEVIKDFTKVVQDSEAEQVACLNIDLFRV